MEAHSLVKIIKKWSHAQKIENTGHMFSNVYAQMCIHVTIFSTGGKFQPVLNFT